MPGPHPHQPPRGASVAHNTNTAQAQKIAISLSSSGIVVPFAWSSSCCLSGSIRGHGSAVFLVLAVFLRVLAVMGEACRYYGRAGPRERREAGVAPSRRLTWKCRWDWLEKPTPRATSAIGRSVPSRSSLARSTRRATT
jgi:hypothetical protein